MEELVQYVFADANMEILPPEPDAIAGEPTSCCACCGRHAPMDEDSYGICEECLSP